MAKPQSEARRAVTPTLPATRSTAPISSMRPQALARALAAQAKRPLARRIDFWSAAFLGTPYFAAQEEDSESQVSPADRARGVHRLELGWVDCESFVEKVMALSLGRSLEEVSDHLRRIRFHEGVPGTTRRHFTVVKGWLAHNEAAGYLRDLTRGIGGSATRTLEKDLAPTPLWRPYYLRRFFSLGVRAPLGTARIDHIPLGAFPTSGRGGLLGRLPHGAVMHVVSAPHERSPYLVTHVGFVIKTPWGPVLRHASRSPRRRRVEDRPLGPYLVYAGRTPAGPEMRTGLGVHLSELLSPSARPSP
ncbi:MAG: DUF1460 domain-containing protein [Polyangia bacterium]|nr:DUF1460 domain-containing protein [Polyangia bacterium]